MKYLLLPTVFAVLFSIPSITWAESSAIQKEEVLLRLSTLNGQALYCKALGQVRTIKQVIIENAPKEREFGEAFEDATNTAYLQAVTTQAPCPSATQLKNDINAAVTHFKAIFNKD